VSTFTDQDRRDFEQRLRDMERWAARADVLVEGHEKRLVALEPIVDRLADAAESQAAVADAIQRVSARRRAAVSRSVSWAAGAAGVLGLALRIAGRG
jgi:ferric-dicitrate binding protein FerR (iron transport regulator)